MEILRKLCERCRSLCEKEQKKLNLSKVVKSTSKVGECSDVNQAFWGVTLQVKPEKD